METENLGIEGNVLLLKAVVGALGEQATPEMTISVYQEVCKDRRMIWIQKQRDTQSSTRSEGASQKQLDYLESLGGKPTPNMSKQAASDAIKAALEKK
jgi:hypothetical protein|tara:strand:+ start:6353 stop:6646 length:294 start_codon:yes stop_codon:yes gene_type:complete